MDEENSRIPDPIQWEQGMLLSPKHFLELGGRYEMLQQQMAVVQPFGWGVTRFRYDKAALGLGKVDISELEAVMPDGTAISAGPGDIPLLVLERPTSPSVQTIFLALPARRDFVWKGTTARYQPVAAGGAGAIGRLRPLLSLHAGKPTSRFVSIPLLQLRYSSDFRNEAEPSWLNVPRDSGLIEICTKIVSLLRNKIGFLVAQIRNPAQALTGVPELRDRLRSLVSGLPALEVHLKAGQNGAGQSGTGCGHPFPLYLALCTIAGNVALIGHDLAPPDFDAYDHSNQIESFRKVALFIETSVNQGVSEHWVPYRFEQTAGGFELTPSEALMHYTPSETQWPTVVIGLRTGPGQTRRTILDWGERCLIASGDVTAKRENRVRGAGRTEWEDPPDLTPPAGVLLFAVDKGDHSLNFKETLHLIGDTPLPAEAILFVRQHHAAKHGGKG
jgi:type VI secretion system protein ImpJ